jgi:hypothetical protein
VNGLTSMRQAGPLEEVDADHNCCADDECDDTVSASPFPSPSCGRRRPHAMVARSMMNYSKSKAAAWRQPIWYLPTARSS